MLGCSYAVHTYKATSSKVLYRETQRVKCVSLFTFWLRAPLPVSSCMALAVSHLKDISELNFFL